MVSSWDVAICCVLTCSILVLIPTAQAGPSTWVYDSNKAISGLSLSSDSSKILTSGERITCLSNQGEVIWGQWFGDQAAISGDGSTIIYSFGPKLTLLDANGTRIWEKELAELTQLSISRDGSRIYASDISQNVYFLNRTGDLLATKSIRYVSKTRITDLELAGKGGYLLVVTNTGFYRLTNSGRTNLEFEDEAGLNGGSCGAISDEGKAIAIGSEHQLRYYYVFDFMWEYNIGDQITCVALSSDGSYIAVGARDNSVHLFSSSGKKLWSYPTGFWVNDVDISADGSRIIAGSMDNKVYIFDRNGTVLSTEDLNEWVENVEISGAFAAAASENCVVGIAVSMLPSVPDAVDSDTAPPPDPATGDMGSKTPEDHNTVPNQTPQILVEEIAPTTPGFTNEQLIPIEFELPIQTPDIPKGYTAQVVVIVLIIVVYAVWVIGKKVKRE
jgi:WD40 repeat protein